MTTLSVRVHPVALLNIVNAFERRSPDQSRVIGTLLGNHDKSGNVEITNSFVVQHREANGEVAIDIELAKELYELYRRVNVGENIVGWFATGETHNGLLDVNEYSVLIHDYYSRETSTPVHLTVSPNRDQGDVVVKGYVSTSFGVPGKTIGTMFSPVSSLTKVAGYETELVGLKACMSAAGIPSKRPVSFESEVQMILSAAHKCSDNIDVLLQFIDENILNARGEIPTYSNDIGRQLMAMVESLSPFSEDDETVNTNLKDLLMVIYLSNLTKTQLMLNEKLSLL
ncbi:Eukaryotic translation initiation factor 3 subunit F [Halotydeus destructor]|nr:Eukaryotic translation initiation factor 3 subunit F [Halotydeus destructor]